jgi:hypothetical protein
MAMVGQKTEEVYRRYAIVDEAMIREAATKMDRGHKRGGNYCTVNCTIDAAAASDVESLGKSINAVWWPRG